MRLKGILSSKARKLVNDFNLSVQTRMPTDPLLKGHTPIPQRNGALRCSHCTGDYSPAAFAQHLAGRCPTDADGLVFITGRDDTWLTRTRPSPSQDPDSTTSAEWRQSMVDAYYDQRKQARTQYLPRSLVWSK